MLTRHKRYKYNKVRQENRNNLSNYTKMIRSNIKKAKV